MTSRRTSAPPHCHSCGSDSIEEQLHFGELQRVSSDCQPISAGGRLGVCKACGLAQAIIDPDWRAQADDIYQHYAIYHQSGGIEQPVFDAATGARKSRSQLILDQIRGYETLPCRGRLLDIGCGNGGFLRTCSQHLQGWTLYGSEFDARHRDSIESIPGVEQLYTGSVEAIPGEFDVITLIHVLEHIGGPREFLRQVAVKLRPGGRLVIEVPDCTLNPFILLVADHASHFSVGSLTSVVTSAGFEVVSVVSGRVPKEITLVARRACREWETAQIRANSLFLSAVATDARALVSGNFGLFGTSIAATWLDAQLSSAAQFFVDEDLDRIGRVHRGRRIIGVTEIPAGAMVYIALPNAIAATIENRLRTLRPDVEFRVPAHSAERTLPTE